MPVSPRQTTMVVLCPILAPLLILIQIASPYFAPGCMNRRCVIQNPSHPTCTSSANVKPCVHSGLELDSALQTFFCYTDTQLEDMDQATKKANLAAVVASYVDVALEDLFIREDLVSIVNLVMYRTKNLFHPPLNSSFITMTGRTPERMVSDLRKDCWITGCCWLGGRDDPSSADCTSMDTLPVMDLLEKACTRINEEDSLDWTVEPLRNQIACPASEDDYDACCLCSSSYFYGGLCCGDLGPGTSCQDIRPKGRRECGRE